MKNIFNFLLLKDPHFMFGFKNNIRKKGWEKAIDSKIDQIISYCITHKITTVIITGDLFEKSNEKNWSFKQFQQNKKRLLAFKDAGLTVFSIMGNHDYFDGHETIENTVFGQMVELDLLNYIDNNNPHIFQKDNVYVELCGIDYHNDKDLIQHKVEMISSRPKKGVRLLIMHSNVTDSFQHLTDFTYEHLSQFEVDIIGCGHWHLSPPNGSIQYLNGTHFLNPWNLTRVTREYHTKLNEHIPSFIHTQIDFNDMTNPIITNKEIVLEVLPFSEAFNIDVINLLQELGKTEFSFFEDIDLDDTEDLNDDDILIDLLASSNNISKPAVKRAKELLI